MQLFTRAVHAGSWTLGGHIAAQFLRFGSNLAMTRLLAPEFFGVMALAFTFLFALNMASDLGIQQIVTASKRGEEPRFLQVVWTLETLRGLGIFAIGALIALGLLTAQRMDWLSPDSTYGHPDLPLALGLISFASVIGATSSINLLTKARQLLVARVVTIDIVSQVIGIAVMLAWAFLSPNILALAAGNIATATLKSLLSHGFIDGIQARLKWDRDTVKEIFNFGRWIFLSSLLGFIAIWIDRIILAGQLSATDFGIYTIAVLLVSAPSEIIQRMISSVLFPALSETARDDPGRLSANYYKVRRFIDLSAVGAALFFFIFGAKLVELLYDDRYLSAGAALEIMALSLPIIGLSASSQIYVATGKPWLNSILLVPRVLGLLVLLPTMTAAHGLVGTAWAIVFSQWIALPLIYFLLRRERILSISAELRFVGILVCCLGAAWGIRNMIF